MRAQAQHRAALHTELLLVRIVVACMEASGLVPQVQGQHPDHTAKKPERIFAAVLLGQLLSFLLALTSIISALLTSKVAFTSRIMSNAPHPFHATATCRRAGVHISVSYSALKRCKLAGDCPEVFVATASIIAGGGNMAGMVMLHSYSKQPERCTAMCRGCPFQQHRQSPTMLCWQWCMACCSLAGARSDKMGWEAMLLWRFLMWRPTSWW